MIQKTLARKVLQNARFRRGLHTQSYDIAVVGGGIVGVSTARELLHRYPEKRIVILEKEAKLAIHQTGNNSGVIHAGMYYKPGSLKAKLCVNGMKLLYQYCDEHKVPYKKVGKLIVAQKNEEVLSLQGLYDRGRQNNVEGLSLMTSRDIKDIEPHCKGVAALHSSNTGIVDYRLFTESLAHDFSEMGGTVITEHEVSAFELEHKSISGDNGYPLKIKSNNKLQVSCKHVITCAGLFSDRLSSMTGGNSTPKIIPFRGDYFLLKEEKSHLVRGNIYPVPDPRFPFLGVHFTPRMNGQIWLGPTAILAFKREGYKLTDVNVKDFVDSVAYRGFQKFLMKHWKHATKELFNAFHLRDTLAGLQAFIPEIKMEDIERGPSGVRAMALDTDGNLVDDFVFDISETDLDRRCLHVRNAPSPAATSSLAIAQMIADKMETIMH